MYPGMNTCFFMNLAYSCDFLTADLNFLSKYCVLVVYDNFEYYKGVDENALSKDNV